MPTLKVTLSARTRRRSTPAVLRHGDVRSGDDIAAADPEADLLVDVVPGGDLGDDDEGIRRLDRHRLAPEAVVIGVGRRRAELHRRERVSAHQLRRELRYGR